MIKKAKDKKPSHANTKLKLVFQYGLYIIKITLPNYKIQVIFLFGNALKYSTKIYTRKLYYLVNGNKIIVTYYSNVYN